MDEERRLAARLTRTIVTRARDVYGWTQEELAMRSRINASRISRLLKSEGANTDTIARLARTVELRLDLVPDDDYETKLRTGRLLDLR